MAVAIGRRLVGIEHLGQFPLLAPSQGLAEEALRRLGVASRREVEIDGVAELVERTVQIRPLAADLDVGLVNTPARRPGAPAKRSLGRARTVRAGARWQVAPETTLNLTAVTTALSVRVARGACLGTLVSQGPLQRQFELLDLVGFLFVALPSLHASDGCDAGVAGGHLVAVLVAQGDRDMCVGGGGPRASPWSLGLDARGDRASL